MTRAGDHLTESLMGCWLTYDDIAQRGFEQDRLVVEAGQGPLKSATFSWAEDRSSRD